MKGQSYPPNTDLSSVSFSADYSLCFMEGPNARSMLEGNSSHLRSGGSGEDVVDEEL